MIASTALFSNFTHNRDRDISSQWPTQAHPSSSSLSTSYQSTFAESSLAFSMAPSKTGNISARYVVLMKITGPIRILRTRLSLKFPIDYSTTSKTTALHIAMHLLTRDS